LLARSPDAFADAAKSEKSGGRGLFRACCARMKRKILVILSNRWNRTQKPGFLELDCDAEGNIHKQRKLRRQPAEPLYDEVWENDEGRTDFDSCHSFARKYGHKLQQPKTETPPKGRPRK
jgi:hypothetical protein